MKEHRIILKDLKKYLKERGVESELEDYNERLRVIDIIGSYAYIIFNGHICFFFTEDPVVSLADPEYREKFYNYIIDIENF